MKFYPPFILKNEQYILLPGLVFITLICFSPTVFNDFQQGWDDWWQLIENPFVLQHSFSDILYHFTHFYHGQYSPINTLFYIGIYEIFGMMPMAFHVACLLMHIVNVLLVYFIVKIILSFAKPSYSSKRLSALAFLTTATTTYSMILYTLAFP